MPYPEAGSLESATQEWLQLKNLLEITAQKAAKSARSVKDTPLRPARKGAERQTEDQLGDLVTIEAANIYEHRTGKSAVRNIDRADGKPFGDFHNFLTRVFEVLEIKSSPDARNMQMQATFLKK